MDRVAPDKEPLKLLWASVIPNIRSVENHTLPLAEAHTFSFFLSLLFFSLKRACVAQIHRVFRRVLEVLRVLSEGSEACHPPPRRPEPSNRRRSQRRP